MNYSTVKAHLFVLAACFHSSETKKKPDLFEIYYLNDCKNNNSSKKLNAFMILKPIFNLIILFIASGFMNKYY